MGSGKDLVADAIFHRAHQGGFASGGAQHGIQDERRRRLAIGAGDSGDRQPFRRTAIEVCAQPRQRSPSVWNLRPGDIGPGRQRVADNRNGSCTKRGIDVVIAVGGLAAHGHETPAGLHPPAVVVETGDLRIALLREIFGAIQQLEEIHSTRIIAMLRWQRR